MQTTLIDSHCHLEYDYAPKTTDVLIEEAKAAGVGTLITIGTDVASWPRVALISERYPEVFHTVGMHPHEAIAFKDEHLSLLEKAASHPKCVAIGEIGLDYHYDHSPREVQRARLSDQLALARKLRLPVVIHSRDGEEDMLSLLSEHVQELKSTSSADLIPGVIHCFTGTEAFGKTCLELGFFISLSGIITFKKAEDLRQAVQSFPVERLLVETDSPYLAPAPFRGKKCEPSMIRRTAEKLAEIQGLSLEEIAEITSFNARRVFRM